MELGKFWQRGLGLEELGRARSSSSTWQRPGLPCARGYDAKIAAEPSAGAEGRAASGKSSSAEGQGS